MHRSLASLVLVITAALSLTSCTHREANDGAATARERTTEVRRPPSQRAPQREQPESGGLVEAFATFLEGYETASCIDDASAGATAARRGAGGGKTLRAVAREVERLRRLRFSRVPSARFVTAQRLTRLIKAEVDKYPAAEAAADGRALVALGALPDGTDLKALLRRALAGQVAGFYDPRTERLVVGSNARSGLDGLERLILAHELEHALADQVLGLPRLLRTEVPPQGAEDAALAARALVEGDATLTMELYAAGNLSFLDALRSLAPALAAEQRAADLPYYLQASSLFPYFDGESFVCELVARGGWRAVDRAYRRPPTTSAQILFPERYFAREGALDVPPLPSPGRSWRLLDVQALGAADLLWLFEAPGGNEARALSSIRDRVAAWAGGEMRVWGRGRETTLALAFVERPAERDLCASIRAWLRALVAERARQGGIQCSGRNVHVGIASNAQTARRLAGPGARAVSR